jgi:uncharacterized protein
MKRIEMTVGAIAIDRNGEPIVLLNDLEEKRTLPIWVGLLEARAISLTTQKIKTKRPLTHQLMLNTIHRLGFSIKEILIDVARSDNYVASIVLSPSDENSGREETSIDARPSDAIAIAIMSGLPVLVDREIVAQSSLAIHRDVSDERAEHDVSDEHGDHDENEKRLERDEHDDRQAFKIFVDKLKASDFKSTEPIELPNDNIVDWPEAS